MKYLIIIFSMAFISCGKKNLKKASYGMPLIPNQSVQETEKEGIIHPKISSVENVELKFLGDTVFEKRFDEISIDADVYFKKKWTFLSKLNSEQDDRQFDFPIDEIDRRMTLIRLHSLNQSNLFRGFEYSTHKEVEIKFSLKVSYETIRKLSLRNVQVKLYSLDNDFKKYELAESPLLKYDSENEDLEIKPGEFTPNYSYQLTFYLSPEDTYKILIGKRWLGLYLSNMELEFNNKTQDYKNLWEKEFSKPKTWIESDGLKTFSGDRDAHEIMKEIDSEIEFSNDFQVMYFFERRSNSSGKWRVLKNEKFQYVSYISPNDHDFGDEHIELQSPQGLEENFLVELRGHVTKTARKRKDQWFFAIVDKPRRCSRWTRFEKAECYDIDLRCHISIHSAQLLESRSLNVSDLPGGYEQRGDKFSILANDLKDIGLPQNNLNSEELGIVSFGHCPSKNEAGFKLREFPQWNWLGETGTRYELQVVYKKPAAFQLWF